MADVEAAIATACGMPAKEVSYFSRRLREHDLVIRETRSPRSWRSGPHDAAVLVAALMSRAPTGLAAPAAVVAMQTATLSAPHAKAIREKFSFLPELQGALLDARTFVGGMAAVITHVRESLAGTSGGYLVRAYFDYSPIENRGIIGLVWRTALATAETVTELEYQGRGTRIAGLTSRFRLHHAAIIAIAELFRA